MHGTTHPDAAVEVVDVTAGYEQGVPVFSGWSAAFEGRGVTLVSGPNGSGKSTLVELCSGYMKPWEGSVRINGVSARAPEARARRRVCRAEPALYPSMTARDHLAFASRCVGADPGHALAKAAHYGLAPWLEYDAKSLSTGNRRKLWVVMCTLGQFDVVILDEPFNGLDADGVDTLCDELRAWADSRAVVLVAHSPPAGADIDHTVELVHDQAEHYHDGRGQGGQGQDGHTKGGG